MTWPQGKNPKTEHLHSLAGQGALSGTFWGMLFGLIFFDPCLGPAGGATDGALGGEFNDFGIDDNFVRLTRSKVTEGASALFLLTSGALKEGIIAALQSQTFELIAANLPHEKVGALRAAFGAE